MLQSVSERARDNAAALVRGKAYRCPRPVRYRQLSSQSCMGAISIEVLLEISELRIEVCPCPEKTIKPALERPFIGAFVVPQQVRLSFRALHFEVGR